LKCPIWRIKARIATMRLIQRLLIAWKSFEWWYRNMPRNTKLNSRNILFLDDLMATRRLQFTGYVNHLQVSY
jgi:uncharacterized protein YqcC (DUF446 family)